MTTSLIYLLACVAAGAAFVVLDVFFAGRSRTTPTPPPEPRK